MALAASGSYEEAEEALLLIQNDDFRSDYYYQAWLSYCYIATGKADLAWELHLRTEASSASFRLQANFLPSVILSETVTKGSSPNANI